MGLHGDISKYNERRKKRLDERKKRYNLDFEVGDFAPDEPGDKGTSGHGNTRLPYGLCKAAGIETEGMTPTEAWEALEGKTGIKAKEAYEKLEKEGTAEKLAKEAEKLSKKKKKKVKDPEEVAGTEDFEEKMTFAPDKPLPPLTPTTFNSTIATLKSGSSSVKEFAKKIAEQIMPRIVKGQTVSAGGHQYYCNGEGFETESGEERTRAFVAFRLAKYSKESGSSLSLMNSSSVHGAKESEKAAAKASANSQFHSAMVAAMNTVKSATIHPRGKCSKHVKLVLDEVPIGSKIKFAVINEYSGEITTETAEKVGDDLYYLSSGSKRDARELSRTITTALQESQIPTLDAVDLSLPNELMTTGGYKYTEKPVVASKPAPSSAPHKTVTAAMKSALKKTGTAIKALKTPTITTSKLPTLKNDSKTRSAWRTFHSKMFKKADVEAIEQGMKRLFEENELCMNRKGSGLLRLLHSGFKNQIEVLEGADTTKASYENPDERRVASLKLFGTPKDTKAEEYEKYGYLGNPWSYDGDYGKTYGDVVFVFDKEKLRDRLTYTLGDSLGPSVNRGMVAGRYGETPSFEGWYLSRPKAKALKMLKEGASLGEILSATKNAYLELQFHGPLTMSDVKCIVFQSEMAYKSYVTAEMQAAFDELGIEVSFKG